MPQVNQYASQYKIHGEPFWGSVKNREWENSSRLGGTLRLTAQKHRRIHYESSGKQGATTRYGGRAGPPGSIGWSPYHQGEFLRATMRMPDLRPVFARLEQQSYASFRRKLYKGSASLGVTVGSYKQSREMIVTRFGQLRRPWESIADSLEFVFREDKRKKSRMKLSDKVASTHLEIIFGMVPLYQDIVAAATTVVQQAAQRNTVIAKSSATDRRKWDFKTDPYTDRTWNYYDMVYRARVTRAAQVIISNPNLWLAERAGTLNVAAVAWDLVPWSFVVNMFGNIGQLVNSITDYAGLTFQNDSTTTVLTSTLNTRCLQNNLSNHGYVETSRQEWRSSEKVRVLGAVARPPLILKIPDASWELAAIAASLVTQKIARVVRLLT